MDWNSVQKIQIFYLIPHFFCGIYASSFLQIFLNVNQYLNIVTFLLRRIVFHFIFILRSYKAEDLFKLSILKVINFSFFKSYIKRLFTFNKISWSYYFPMIYYSNYVILLFKSLITFSTFYIKLSNTGFYLSIKNSYL